MTLFSDIQARVKEGQQKLTPVVNSVKTNPTVEAFLSKPEVQKALSQGQGTVHSARTQIEELVDKVEAAVRDVESQGRTLLQSSMNQAVNSSRKFESGVVEAANRALDEGQKLAEQNAPFLVDYVGAMRKAVQAAESAFNKVQASAAASAGTLPISDYDSLNAKTAASAVKKLSTADLEIVLAYEKANKNRVTVTKEIEGLLAE